MPSERSVIGPCFGTRGGCHTQGGGLRGEGPGMVLASRKATVAAAALLALVVLGAMFLWLRDSSLVGVRQVDITGVAGRQADEIRGALTDAARDMTTLHVREDALRDAVQSYPVVRELHADADFPHRLRITVNSYDPIGAMELGGRSVAIARDGTVLDGTPTKGLAAIRRRAPPRARRSRAPRRRSSCACWPPRRRRCARARCARTRARTVSRSICATARDSTSATSTQLDAKWLAAAAVLADEDSRGASYVDVRLPERPVAGPLPATKEGAQGEPSTSP